MNARESAVFVVPCTPDAVRLALSAAYADKPTRYRDRNAGVGYGRSSGYGLDRRDTRAWGSARFRFR